MRQRRTLLITSMIVFTVLGTCIYLLNTISTGSMHRRESPQLVSIEVWLYTPELSSFFLDYKAKNPHVNIEIRTFRSYEQLYNELIAAISAQHAPQMAEVNSHYGIAQLAASESLLSVDHQLPASIWAGMMTNAPDYFQYREQRWAIPYGLSINVLYYNENLMTYSSMDHITTLRNWDDLLQADNLLAASRQASESRMHWGLVVDREIPWYLYNIAAAPKWKRSHEKERWTEVFAFWKRLIHERQMMPPLQHHLAMSDFMDGRAVLFLSSSANWPILENYIGGRFAFGMLPIPYSHRSTPKVSGLAVLSSTAAQEEVALDSIAFLLEEEQQRNIWEVTGLSPVWQQAVDQLYAELADHPLQHAIMQQIIAQETEPKQPLVVDKEVWKLLEEIGEELELSDEQSLDSLLSKLISKGGEQE